MTAIAPVITIDGPSGAGKAPCVRLWRKHCNGICWIRVQFIAYWHWRHYITMLMLRQKMRWYRWHPIWMYVLCQPMAIWK